MQKPYAITKWPRRCSRTFCAAGFLWISFWALPAAAQEEDFDITISFDFSKATVSGYNGPGGAVTIPSTILGVPVVAIGTGVFAGNSTVTSVTVPAGVTNVGNYAFATNANLTGVYFAGNAPGAGTGVFASATPTVYRLSTATGWGSTFGGRPTATYEVSTLSISPPGWLVAPAASTVPFAVSNTGSGTLTYEASESDSWLAIAGGGSGTNTGTITVSYSANAGATARTGTVTVTAPGANGSPTILTVIQEKSSTTPVLSVSPAGWWVGPASGTASFAVTNLGVGTLTYVASEAESWLSIAEGGTGTNGGTFSVAFTENASSVQRTGTVTVAASGATGNPATLLMVQAASGVTLAIAPVETNLASGAAIGLPVYVAAVGVWTASVDQAWISILAGGTGSGNGLVAYSVSANNTGSARTATLVITGGGTARTSTVTQAAADVSLAISPSSRSHSAAAESGQTISVTAGMDWTATSSADWISITGGSSGSGNGTVTYGVSANSGAARSSSIVVAGGGITRTFTVSQGAPDYPIEISPSSRTHPVTGATGQTISVSASVAWTAVSSANWITLVSGSSGSGNGTVTYNVASNGGGLRSGTLTVSGEGGSRTFTVQQWATPLHPGVSAEGDFDGDSKADIAVYDLDSGDWHVRFSSGPEWTVPWGHIELIPPSADYDGDGQADSIVFDSAQGRWVLVFSSGGQWTLPRDVFRMAPIPADYDGDGLLDFAVYHPITGNWHILKSTTSQASTRHFGWSRTVPLPGDYDGDGKADLALYDPATGRWHFRCTLAGEYSAQWGLPGVRLIPVPADYDGDGATDMAVYHPDSGGWYVLRSTTGRMLQKSFGGHGTLPVPADYDSDGKADFGLYHRGMGVWFLSFRTGGMRTVPFGGQGTIPVPADYDGDGAADLAVHHLGIGGWYILQSTTEEILAQSLGGASRIPVLLVSMLHAWFGLL